MSATELLKASGFDVNTAAGDTIEVFVTGESVDRFIKTVAQFTVLKFDVKTQSLEDIFMHFYGREGK